MRRSAVVNGASSARLTRGGDAPSPPSRRAHASSPLHFASERLQTVGLHRGEPGEEAVTNLVDRSRIHGVELLLAATGAVHDAALAQDTEMTGDPGPGSRRKVRRDLA